MKKKYIMIAHIISTMGGGQIYARNKINFMESCGYDSYIVSLKGGKVLIGDLLKFENNYIDYFSVNPRLLSNNKIKKVLKKLESIVGNIDENTIIESNAYTGFLWGEIIANEYKCRHYVYIIIEKLPKIDECMYNYFKFKRNRNELNGVKSETYKMIFNHYPDEDNYDYCLPLVCTNVVDNCKNEIIDNIKYQDFNISTIGRLSKEYVPTLIKEVIKFANNHKKIKITYIMIGSAKKRKKYREIEKEFKKVENVQLYLVGNIYPIPVSFFKKVDVFISSAGSVRVSANLGKPTITIDGRDYQSIGIFNYNTNNSLFRDNEPKVPISEALEYLYKNELYKKIKIKKINGIESKINDVLELHLKQYQKNKKKYEYFNFYNYKLTKKEKIGKIIVSIFGVKIYMKLHNKFGI